MIEERIHPLIFKDTWTCPRSGAQENLWIYASDYSVIYKLWHELEGMTQEPIYVKIRWADTKIAQSIIYREFRGHKFAEPDPNGYFFANNDAGFIEAAKYIEPFWKTKKTDNRPEKGKEV